MGWLESFFSNLGDSLATGGNREAFNARRGARLQREGRDPEWNRFTASLGRVARQAWEDSEHDRRKAEIAAKMAKISGDHEVQYEDVDYSIEVKSGYSIDKDCWTTDVRVYPRAVRGGAHWHVVFDGHGNIIHNGWRDTGRNK